MLMNRGESVPTAVLAPETAARMGGGSSGTGCDAAADAASHNV